MLLRVLVSDRLSRSSDRAHQLDWRDSLNDHGRSDGQSGADEGVRGERFVQMLGAHERQIFSYVYALTVNWNDAQEVMQRVRIRLWQQFDRYDEEKPFGAWARAIAYYMVLAFRKEKSRQREYFSEKLMELVSDSYEQSADMVSVRREALQGCLEKLNAKHRSLVDSYYAKNERISEIAGKLDLSANALRQTLFRIRKVLLDCVHKTLRSV